MFTHSIGPACTAVFASKAEFKRAVVACLKLSPEGDCPNGSHGPIEDWDVSGITDMEKIFDDASSFNGDISKWDVSSVKTTVAMFAGAFSFNVDLSRWDMSSVVDMGAMFWGAAVSQQSFVQVH